MSSQTTEKIQHVLVVGGGAAGWLTACHLAKKLKPGTAGGVKVTLLESPDIPIIGVGESTVPAIRRSLSYLGISETDLVRHCEATFKQSIKFVDWVHNPVAGQSSYYHHLFDYPDAFNFDLTPYWLAGTQAQSYADALTIQGKVCDAGLGPKQITHAEFAGLTNYAYHLDATQFAALLAKHGTEKLGVSRLLANVTDVQLTPAGGIAAVSTDSCGAICADLYVDCTGSGSLLLGQALNVPFISRQDVLFADHALAFQLPYESEQSPIPSFTIATAKEAGWIWDIGLSTRRGTGYVYSSSHTCHEQAEQTFRDYLGPAVAGKDVRRIAMQVGYRQCAWKQNCVAIGLSQGFVEPLEATGLLVFDATARMLADQFPASVGAITGVAKRFNQKVQYSWDKVIDFIKLHYFLSKRDDSQFWLDNRDPAYAPDSLVEQLAFWQQQLPSHYDFPSRFEIFNLDNYQYVMYGMNFQPEASALSHQLTDPNQAQLYFNRMQQQQQHALAVLPTHRALIEKIKQFGLQKV
mgnify:CR=1 FL=1